ncbi:hypothetical protein QJQ45_024465 [Haematococcus lacustris]|nr:hypothetical protein QJQ45_024465 [Haematococcus lacustris]
MLQSPEHYAIAARSEQDRVKRKIAQLKEELDQLPAGHPEHCPLRQQLEATQQQLAAAQQELAARREKLLVKKENMLLEASTVKELLEEIRAALTHMHHKRFRPAPSSQRSEKWRDSCLDTYDPPALSTDDATLPCVALGGRYDRELVKATHIYRRDWDRDELLAVHVPIHSPSNVIPLHKNMARALGRFFITIVPDAGDVFKLKVLDPSLLAGDQSCVVEGVQWADLDGKDLTFDSGVTARPSAWVCAFHAKHALAYATDPFRRWIAEGSYKLPRFVRSILKAQNEHVNSAHHESDSLTGRGSRPQRVAAAAAQAKNREMQSNFEEADR